MRHRRAARVRRVKRKPSHPNLPTSAPCPSYGRDTERRAEVARRDRCPRARAGRAACPFPHAKPSRSRRRRSQNSSGRLMSHRSRSTLTLLSRVACPTASTRLPQCWIRGGIRSVRPRYPRLRTTHFLRSPTLPLRKTRFARAFVTAINAPTKSCECCSCARGFPGVYRMIGGDFPSGAAPDLLRRGARSCVCSRFHIDARFAASFFPKLASLLANRVSIEDAVATVTREHEGLFDFWRDLGAIELLTNHLAART